MVRFRHGRSKGSQSGRSRGGEFASAIVSAAMSLALSLRHKVPDCLYLALAQREGAALATADATLQRLAESQGTIGLAPA